MRSNRTIQPTDTPRRFTVLETLFGLVAPVDRKTYVLAGISLMALKYAIDAAIVYGFMGKFLRPITYLMPSLTLREATLGSNVPTAMHAAMALVALPFVWVGLSMSLRRAMNAGGVTVAGHRLSGAGAQLRAHGRVVAVADA